MFVQLQLAGLEGRMVDPSKIPIIDPSERSPIMKAWGVEQFMSQVIVEFCNEQNSITSEMAEEPTEKNDFQLDVPHLIDDEGGEDQEEELTPATSITELEQDQQSETGGPSTIEEPDKKELVNESDIQNKDIDYIPPEAPELESPPLLQRRTTRNNRNKKDDIIGSPTSVAQHLTTLLDNNTAVGSPARNTPRCKRPHLSRRSSSRLQQAPMSVPPRPRPSLLNKLEKIASRRSVAPSVGKTMPETEEAADNVPRPPTPTPRRRRAAFGTLEGSRSLRGLANLGSSTTSMHGSRRKVISKSAADRLGRSLPLIRSMFDDENPS